MLSRFRHNKGEAQTPDVASDLAPRQDYISGLAESNEASGYADDNKYDEKKDLEGEGIRPVLTRPESLDESVADEDIDLATGKEKPLVTAVDITERALSLDDDPTLPVWTFRMWFLGLGLTCFASVLGQIFYFRPQTVYVSQLFLQIIAFILGEFLARVIPSGQNRDNKFWKWMNPGPFNLKEHTAILIMSSCATSSAEAISVYATDDLYYNISPNVGVAIFTLIGSQLLGYGIAGLCRSFLVYPSFTLFPNLIPTVQLFDALHRDHDKSAQRKRVKFFWIVFIAIFCWEFVPEFIAPTLTGFSIFCLARQNSPWVTRIFGGSNGNEGLGLFSLCFDWAYVGSGGGSLGALFTPLSTQLSQYSGVLLCILISIGMYKTNAWNSANFPFLSQDLFYLNGTVYDQTLILNPSDYSLNKTLLAEQGLPWFAGTNAVYFLGSNLAIGATFTHVALWYWPDIKAAIAMYREGGHTDAHYKIMEKNYPEVPYWWYGFTLVGSFAMAMATIYAGHSTMSWWMLIVALLVAMFAYPFVCAIYAVSGFNTDMTQLSQMLGAALKPGHPQANMYFVLYSYQSVAQAIHMTRDMKMGQYTKLPPRCTFTIQIIGSIIAALLNYIIMKSIISNQRELLLGIQGSNIWSGQQVQSFNSLAISWGALGEAMYGPGATYFIIPLATVIGLAVPVPFYLAHRAMPKFGFDKVVTPIICWCLGFLSVGINSSVFTTFVLAVISQYYLRIYRPTFFRKYNYLASAALDGGAQIMVFVATFALFGAAGHAATMPYWALNPEGRNYDYCMSLND